MPKKAKAKPQTEAGQTISKPGAAKKKSAAKTAPRPTIKQAAKKVAVSVLDVAAAAVRVAADSISGTSHKLAETGSGPGRSAVKPKKANKSAKTATAKAANTPKRSSATGSAKKKASKRRGS